MAELLNCATGQDYSDEDDAAAKPIMDALLKAEQEHLGWKDELVAAVLQSGEAAQWAPENWQQLLLKPFVGLPLTSLPPRLKVRAHLSQQAASAAA